MEVENNVDEDHLHTLYETLESQRQKIHALKEQNKRQAAEIKVLKSKF